MIDGIELFFSLFNNLAIFIALVAVYSYLLTRFSKADFYKRQALFGLSFGFFAIGCMYAKIPVFEGVIVDQRNAIIALSGAFGGPFSAIISAFMAGTFRIYLGGTGVFAGVFGVCLAAISGVVLYKFQEHMDNAWKIALGALLASIFILPGFLLVGDLPTGWGLLKKMMLPYGSAIFTGIFLGSLLLNHEKKRHNIEAAFRKSEEKYREIFNSPSDAIFIHDASTGAILEVNQSAQDMYGYSFDEIKLLSVGDLSSGHPPYGQKEAEQSIRDAVTLGPQTFEWIAKKKNGDLFWTEVALKHAKIIGQNFIIAAIRDINERKNTEDTLRKWGHVFENAKWGITIGSADGKTIELMNPAYADMHGYSIDELHKLEIQDLFHPSFREDLPDIIKTCHEKGHHTFEADHIRKNGSVFPAFHDVTTVKNQQGTPLYRIVSILDITDRKQAEEDLLASEKRFKDLTENSTDLIWEFDENEIFTYVSPRIKDLLGYTPEEILGQSAFNPMASPEAARVSKEFNYFKDAQKPFSDLVNVNQNKNGSEVILESSGVPIFDKDGKFRGYRGIDRDITKRTNLEDQLRQAHKMEAIGTLAGGIAHDFNNILAAILGYAGMALNDIPDHSPAKYDIEQVLQAGNRAKDLVKHILSFSRKEVQSRSSVQIHLITQEALKLLRASIPTTVEITHKIDTQCGSILAEPTQIHQVLMNLCTNAAQAMDEDGGVLQVEVVPISLNQDDIPSEPNLKPGKYIRISVKDSGVGIEPQNLERIFDPYFTTKEIGKGSGMGLAVVAGIVKSHDGMLTVDSIPGEGTTFYLYFPRIEEIAQEKAEETSPLPTGKEKILVVDDEKNIIDLTRRRLERLGYQVTTQTSSRKALEIFQSQPNAFDLVISDQTMPEMTGANLAKRLKTIKPDIPIILCSGYSSKMDAEKANLAGISAFIMKPVEQKTFAQTVRMVLDDKNSIE